MIFLLILDFLHFYKLIAAGYNTGVNMPSNLRAVLSK